MSIPDFLRSQKSIAGHYLSFAVGLGLMSGFLLILQAWLLAKVIDGAIFKQLTISDVQHWLIAMLIIFLIRALLFWTSEIMAFKAASRVKLGLRDELHQHLLSLGPVAISGEKSGELVNTLVDSVEALEGYYTRYLPAMSLVVLIPLSILVFVFPIDWVSGLVLLLTAPLIPFFMVLIGKGTERLNKKQWRDLARMSAHLLDMIQGLSTLKIFNASRREMESVARISEDYRRSTMSVLRVAFLSSLALEFLASVSIAIVAVLIGFRLYYGELDFFHGFFALLLAPEFYLPLRNMGTHYHARLEAIGATEKIVAIMQKSLPALSTPTQSIDQLESIRFDKVSFAYDKGENALTAFSVEIKAGQRVALIGKSGAGKSTVIRLLAGFVRPSQGMITINGIPFDNLDLAHWREQIALVPQNPHLFYGTVRENIALGKKSATVDAIRTAAQHARIDQDIEKMPQGYDTVIGERGQGLSGGQIQRISLARAFLKDAPLILLDEATANLDAEHEQLIQQSLDDLVMNRTLIMIAHRLKTVEKADQILVMDQGSIIETGNHAQLLEKKGLYAEMLKRFMS